MKRDKLKELYFNWLTQFVCDSYQSKYYGILLGYLYSKEFRWTMDFDENCAINGLELREIFYEEKPVGRKYAEMYGYLDEPCSILELMVSLSIQIEQKIMTNMVENHTSEWFWRMIDSLGLLDYDDGRWEEAEVDLILENFLERRYRKDGKGSLFWCKNAKNDMKKVEIWMQMNFYLRDFIEF